MANDTQWEYANETQARRVQAAFRIAAGLPTRGTYTDPGKGRGRGRGKIPKTHTKNAPGWSEQLVDVEKTRGAGNTHCIQNAAECVPFYGLVIDIGQGPNVTLPTAATAVARVGDWDILPDPNGGFAGTPKGRGKVTKINPRRRKKVK